MAKSHHTLVTNLVALGIFSSYLLALPSLMGLVIPCLGRDFFASYEYNNCNLPLATDLFLKLSLAGAAITMLMSFLIAKRNLKLFALNGLFLSILVVSSFYLYIPLAEKRVNTANIYLDTFYKEYSVKGGESND